MLVGFLLVLFVLGVNCQLGQPAEFALTPEEACRAYPGYIPVTLSPREQSQLLPLGLTQYKVQKQQQCVNGLFIRFEALPSQTVVAVCQDAIDERLYRVLYNITGRCQLETGFRGIQNQLLDASITNVGPAVRFVDEVTLEQVTTGSLIRQDVAANSSFCDETEGFASAALSPIIRGLLTLATTNYKVGLQLDNVCPIGALIFQEEVPEKLLVDVCTNEFDDSVFQVIFNVTTFCVQRGDFTNGEGDVRNDVFTSVITTVPTGILDGKSAIISSTIPDNPPFFGAGLKLVEPIDLDVPKVEAEN
eukprot:TRINITY_DN118_c0_g1_i11.p1 TRINITY_DN118_c0_g1~~TRINITY_DN118_c0_g1_i11.p1  ORF type:complete len:304 (+),score=56.70 TRINITY_DN118_c0_g1_i11:202-1113(+)